VSNDIWFVCPEVEIFSLEMAAAQENWAYLDMVLLRALRHYWHFLHFQQLLESQIARSSV